jgi:hypothetical protein
MDDLVRRPCASTAAACCCMVGGQEREFCVWQTCMNEVEELQPLFIVELKLGMKGLLFAMTVASKVNPAMVR